MNARTLVLTPWYFPFTTVDWRAAVTLLYLRKAEVVATYPEEIRSPSTTIKMPAVIRLRRQRTATWGDTKFSQSDLYLRDDFTCTGCDAALSASQLAYGHLGSRTRGGRTVWTNILTAGRGDTGPGARAATRGSARSTESMPLPLELPLDPPLVDPATAPDEWCDTTAVWRRG